MKTNAEEALRQTLAHISIEDDNVGNLAKSLLAIIDIHLNAKHMLDFWASLQIQEEKIRTRRQGELLVEKKVKYLNLCMSDL